MELILLIYTYNYIIYRYNDKIYLFDCKLEIGIDSKLLRLNPSKSESADKNFLISSKLTRNAIKDWMRLKILQSHPISLPATNIFPCKITDISFPNTDLIKAFQFTTFSRIPPHYPPPFPPRSLIARIDRIYTPWYNFFSRDPREGRRRVEQVDRPTIN